MYVGTAIIMCWIEETAIAVGALLRRPARVLQPPNEAT
jgi:hypothetical protein